MSGVIVHAGEWCSYCGLVVGLGGFAAASDDYSHHRSMPTISNSSIVQLDFRTICPRKNTPLCFEDVCNEPDV